MDEYIKREAVMQKFADHVKRSNNSDFAPTPTWNQAVQIVEDFPAADVQPVKHGKWIKNEDIGVRGVGWHCSICKENDVWAFIDKDEKTQDDLYCPNCGARMDGET